MDWIEDMGIFEAINTHTVDRVCFGSTVRVILRNKVPDRISMKFIFEAVVFE
jgi:hypothetical protein